MKSILVIFITLFLSGVFFMGDSIIATATDDLKSTNQCILKLNDEFTPQKDKKETKVTDPNKVKFTTKKDCR